MMKTFGWIALVAMLGFAPACGANHHSIHRHTPITSTDNAILTIDAKQRAILISSSGKNTDGKTTDGFQSKFCAEPSPDVFSVVAQAVSASGNFGQRADPRAIEAALSAAFSSSEQGSTIPRTQTINMLRELMYRTCERWLNNELGAAEMPIQAARDQRLMVSILAIEQLTGAVAVKPVVLGSASTASGGQSGADATVRIDDAYKALTAKTAAQEARQKDFDGLNTGTNACDTLAKKIEAKEELDADHTAANEKCVAAKSALAQAQLERAAAAGHHQSLIDASRAGGIPVSAGSSADSRVAGGGIDSAHDSDVKNVAAIVKDIVAMNFRQDEFLLFCLKVLNPGKDAAGALGLLATSDNAKDACLKHVETAVEFQTTLLQVSKEEIESAGAARQASIDSLFTEFWEAIKVDDHQADPVKIQERLNDISLDDEKKTALGQHTSRDAIRRWFEDPLVAEDRDALAKGQ